MFRCEVRSSIEDRALHTNESGSAAYGRTNEPVSITIGDLRGRYRFLPLPALSSKKTQRLATHRASQPDLHFLLGVTLYFCAFLPTLYLQNTHKSGTVIYTIATPLRCLYHYLFAKRVLVVPAFPSHGEFWARPNAVRVDKQRSDLSSCQ